ncbi:MULTISPECIES: YfhO family protein [Staphylococcus]|uniref:YfhO family protein n=1 Tax=Staphylococcus TaxID=1279 RepID=UPI0002463091|nr:MULTISPECIES: YfhO family protein [Staphylococcus]AGZ26565.1 bacterial membrane protein YfhO [Staphylococcus pasteuri SP1]KAB7647265.1 YfhO family protein [Staphylococcus sp. B2-b]MBN6851946.1 YfhO family protein [Staphylococcus warneri]MBT2769264.1 YfhO family protein [Staphylococcus warneri]MBX7839347.1 YfhO family protein [Staphylococcus warneri]
MFKKIVSKPFLLLASIIILSCILSLFIYIPFIYRFVTQGIVFSGEGDGFRQMMPFQMYLYEHFTQFKGFYDESFGLGGDYVKGLAYYYSMSPLMWLNFLTIWILEKIGLAHPHDISYWPANQLIMAYVRTVITFVCTFYFFKYIKLKPIAVTMATIMYGLSTVVIYYNFTWSFYGNLLILLPLSLLAMERFFREKKIGLFIFAIALTLFMNFYFSYYQAIVLGFYFMYRVIVIHPKDIVNRWQKCYLLIIGILLSVMSSILGLYTGLSSFFNNDRAQNPKLETPLFTDLVNTNFNIFSDGFYITITFITIIALFSFKLYRHYYFKLFAIVTWILLIGSLSQYFDSAFNGFSMPQRRWVYALTLSSSALVALFIQHISELSLKRYNLIAIPITIYGIIYFALAEKTIYWIPVSIVLICLLAILIKKPQLQSRKWVQIALVLLIFIQQLGIVHITTKNTIEPYQTTMKTIDDPSYRSKTLNQNIQNIKKSQSNPLSRIDYMSFYGLNSPFIYHYNGISLYSSIFDGGILKYYDKMMQINMPVDKNSTYRYLGNRANLMALWGVEDRLRHPNDLNMPYGFEKKKLIKDKGDQWIHSHNTINYPAAHVTNNIYDSSDLKSPLDREQAMIQGIVLNDKSSKPNTSFKPNPNLLSHADIKLNHAKQIKNHQIEVTKNNGGLQLQLPKFYAQRYKDLYVEMDVELLAPDKNHHVSVNEYSQDRNPLTYKYRRFVSPVTMRVKSSDLLNIKLSPGKYRLKVNGIYGENYQTLHKSAKHLNKVDIHKQRNGYTIKKDKKEAGYLVMPIPYTKGMKATIDGHAVEVKKANGIMTAIPVNKGQELIRLTYTPPHFYLLIVISIVGMVVSMVFARKIKKHH